MLEQFVDYDDVLMEQLFEDIQLLCDVVFDDFVCELCDGLICFVLLGLVVCENGVLCLMKVLWYEVLGIVEMVKCFGVFVIGDVFGYVFKILYLQYGGKLLLMWFVVGYFDEGVML